MFNRKTDQFDNILNDCLERILVKGGSIEECLAQYPQQADNLKPLLETALATRKALAIKPRPEFRARARYQFHSVLRGAVVKKRHHPFSWQLRWVATASLTLVLLTGSGVVAAASTSMPDNPLYQVKLATEQIQLFLTTSAEDKAELYAKLADRRVTEIINMAQEGNVSLVELTTERLDNHLLMIASISTSQSGGLLSEGGAEAFTTLTTTKTVTTTIGAGGILTEGTSEPPETMATTDGSITETVPGITTETAIKPGASSWQPCVDDEDFACQLRQDSESNIAALYEALDSASGEVKLALMQAITVLENGYNNALNAIANDATG